MEVLRCASFGKICSQGFWAVLLPSSSINFSCWFAKNNSSLVGMSRLTQTVNRVTIPLSITPSPQVPTRGKRNTAYIIFPILEMNAARFCDSENSPKTTSSRQNTIMRIWALHFRTSPHSIACLIIATILIIDYKPPWSLPHQNSYDTYLRASWCDSCDLWEF